MIRISAAVRFLKGIYALSCLYICSTGLCAFYIIFVLPFIPLSKHYERTMQILVQKIFVYLLLGVTSFCAESKIIVSFERGSGSPMDFFVRRLAGAFNFKFPSNSSANGRLPSADTNRNANGKGNGDEYVGNGSLYDDDDKPGSAPERDIIIANHQLYMDWIYLWSLMTRMGKAGVIKIILKSSLLMVPVLGLGMRLLNFIFLHRNWQVDREKLGYRLRRIVFGDFDFSLLIFPEGTTLCPETLEKANIFASKQGMPPTKHTLCPRVTGMKFAMGILREHISGIWDITVGYGGISVRIAPEDTFGLASMFIKGNAPPTIHFHLDYHPINEIPDKDAFSDWLYERFRVKEKRMEKFYRCGHFGGITSAPQSLSPKLSMLWISLSTLVVLVASVWFWGLVCSFFLFK